jgi:carboxylesterase type B
MRILPLLLTGIWTTFVVSQDSGLRVQTQQGDVLGSLVTPTVRQFLGIPYAVADRWEAPKLPPQRQNVFTADHFGDSCIQMNSSANNEFLKLTGSVVPNAPESENCMSVNIWSPSVDRKQNTSVMIWIYGGGFQFGTVGRLSLVTDCF